MDSASSTIIRSIEKTIEQQIDNELEFNIAEKIGSTLSKKIYTQSINVIKYVDSLRNVVTTSKRKDNYIGDSASNKLKEYTHCLVDSGIKMLPINIRESVYSDIEKILLNNVLLDAKQANKMYASHNKEETIALLAALKNNVLSTTKLITHEILLTYMFTCCFCLNQIRVVSVPDKRFVFKGEHINAIMTLVAFSWRNNIIINSNQGKIPKVENGIATLTTHPHPTTPGIKTLSGTASMQIKDSMHSYPWQTQYYVAPKGIYMHIDNANKCYAGIPFTMTIGVDEYGADKLLLRSKNAVIKKITDSIYSITAPKGVQSFMVYMDAVNKDGSISQSIAAKHIKVLQPIPDIAIGNIQHGLIAKGYIQKHPTLSAIPRDEELDITYYIKQYTISSISKDNRYIEPITINSSKIDTDIIQSLHSGDRLLITDIIATDNYGNTHRLPGTTFRVE